MLDQLIQRYPEDNLYAVPTVPEGLVWHECQQFFYAFNETIELLKSLNLKGYVLCSTMATGIYGTHAHVNNFGNIFVPHRKWKPSESQESSSRDEDSFDSYSNLHQLSQIVLFKNVVCVNSDSYAMLGESIVAQLNLIASNLRLIAETTMPEEAQIPVKIVLTDNTNTKNQTQPSFKNFPAQLQDYVNKNLTSTVFRISFCFDKKNNIKEDSVLEAFSNEDWLKELLAKFVMQTLPEKLPDLVDRRFICPMENERYLCFSDKYSDKKQGQIDEMFKLFFPFFESRLGILPDINRIPSSLLKESNPSAILKNAHQYLGEVKLVWESFFSQLESPAGILIHQYKSDHLDQVLKQKLQRFEFDWLLCSPTSGFTVFEVVRAQDPDNPRCAVNNKLVKPQCMRLLFTLRLILFTFLIPLFPDRKVDLSKWVMDHSRVILCFTNTRVTNVEKTISDDTRLRDSILKSELQLSSLYILSLPDIEDAKIELGSHNLHQFDKNLTLAESNFSIANLFGGFNSITSSECDKNIRYASALIVFSYLVNPKDEIEQPSQDPLNPDERFTVTDPCRFLDIILTPQQKEVLDDNPRNLFLMGEPGSGKTSVLLAKACITAESKDFDHVFFAIPSHKTELRETVEDFVKRHITKHAYLNKIKCISVDELKDDFKAAPDDDSVLTLSKLHKSLLILDEMYIEATEELTEGDLSFSLVKLLDSIYHSKQCWVTNLQAGQMSTRKNIYHKLLLPNFEIRSFNILLRSAHHISAFSTSFIHKSKPITQTSARIPGCFVSTQTEISLEAFKNHSEFKLDNKPNVNQKFKSDRRAIIFSDISERWTHFVASNAGVKTTIVSSGSDFYSAPYTGCEALSVIIIIDNLPPMKHDKRTFSLINLAITRAQYEVCIFSSENCYKRVEEFLKARDLNVGKAMFDAANTCSFSCQFDEYSKWDTDTHTLASNLIQIAIQTGNKPLLNKVLEMYPGKDGEKPLPMRKILTSLDHPKDDKFMKYLTTKIGKQAGQLVERLLLFLNAFPKIYPEASELMDTGVIVGYTQIIDWYFDLVPNKQKSENFLLRYKRLLFCACQNGKLSTLDWAFKKLTKEFKLDSSVKIELESKYDLLSRGNATLLLTLCYARGEIEAVEYLFNQGFPNSLLLDTYLGKNALQFAVDYEDHNLVELLLKTEERTEIFFRVSPTPLDYAKDMGFIETADFIKTLRTVASLNV